MDGAVIIRFDQSRNVSAHVCVRVCVFVSLIAAHRWLSYTVSIVDCCVSLAVPRTWRLSPWLRPFLLIFFSDRARYAAFSSMMIWWNVIDIFALIFLMLLLFAWVGLVLWRGTNGSGVYFTGYVLHNRCSRGMSRSLTARSLLPISYLVALRELHVALTTANFPDIMAPAYGQSSLAILFYLAFYVVGLFFLLPLMLASIFSTYKQQLMTEAAQFTFNRNHQLQAAYYVLDSDRTGNLPLSVMNQLVGELNKFLFIPYITRTKKRMMFTFLDESADGLVRCHGWVVCIADERCRFSLM